MAILFIIFAVTLTNFFSSLYFTKKSITEAAGHDLSLARDIADGLITTNILFLQGDAAAIAERLRMAETGEEMEKLMKSKLDRFPAFTGLTVFDHEKIIARAGQSADAGQIPEISPYIQIARDGKPVISTTISDGNMGVVMYVFTPVSSGMVLGATISGMTFSDLLSDYKVWQTGSIYMLDGEGTVIANFRKKLVLERQNYINEAKRDPRDHEMKTMSEFIQQMLAAEEGRGHYKFDGVERLCTYKRISNGETDWYIAVALPLNEIPFSDVQRGLLFASLLFLIAGCATAVSFSGLAVRPFYKIEAQNRNLEKLNETVRDQADKIRKAHDRTLLMIDASPLCINLWSRDFRIFACNEEAVKLFKLRDQQDYLERFSDLSPKYQPDGQLSAEKAVTYIRKAFAEGKCVFEWMHQLLDGTPIPAEITLIRVEYEDDHVVAGYARDLREHKQMMEEIERRNVLLKTVNRVAAVMLTAEDEENIETSFLEGMELMGRCVDVDRVQIWKNEMEDGELYFVHRYEWLSDVGRQKVPVPGGLKFRYSDVPGWKSKFLRGEYINGPLSAMPQRDQFFLNSYEIKSIVIIPLFLHDQFWGFFSLDDCRHERTFSEEEISILRSGGMVIANALLRNGMLQNIAASAVELEEALEKAQKASRVKSNFLAKMSHEMRTPLNAIIGFSELALADGELSGKSYENLENIYNAGAVLLRTVNDILDISKIEAGKFELVETEYDLPSMINDTITQSILHIGEKPITFVLDIGDDLPVRLYGDELRIKQMFNNLLSNAFKYTKEGTVELGITCTRDDDAVWMTARIKDTGIGIRQEALADLFSEYAQMDKEANRKIEGVGLGLSITSGVVKMMGGTITAESEYGKGSVFTIRFRQKFVSDTVIGPKVAENLKRFRHTATKRKQNAWQTRITLPYARVLVVDDLVPNLDVARGMMKPYGMQIDCVTGGQQAIDAVRAEDGRYNAIFMDHMMPGMDGIEATRIIREEIGTEYAKTVPIIALTANAISGNEQMFLANGFQAFVSKPIDIAQLDAVIRKWVRDRSKEEKEEHEEFPSGEKRREIKITGLNTETGLARFGGDENAYLAVLHSYAASTPSLLEQLRNVTPESLPGYAVSVHGLKGSSGNIGAEAIMKEAAFLEELAKSGDFPEVLRNNHALLIGAEKLVADIQAWLGEYESRAELSKPRQPAPGKELLCRLRQCCEKYDMDGIDMVMDELESASYDEDESLISWLREKINASDFSEAVKRLTKHEEV
jgi:signal transduction histidine kinase/DNA-binding response OmpR family regulator/PAS domain-containing protein